MRPRVKICCIQSVAEAEIAIAAGASLIGLVGAMPSGPGPISDERIAEICRLAPPGVETVLLSSEITAYGLTAHVARCQPSILQIVDDPDPDAYAALRTAHPSLKLMQVVHVEDEAAIDQARTAARHVDAILLDSGRPSATVKELGGTGRTHNWAISARLVAAVDKPVFLAGGLDAGNVAEAVAQVRPYGLDLCSKVRTVDQLDAAKLTAFMKAAQTA